MVRINSLLSLVSLTLDVFLEWITPREVDEKTGKVRKVGIKLGADQRLLLRTMCRFKDNF